MDLILISSDSKLYKLCGEVLRDLTRIRWNFSRIDRWAPTIQSADLYIWDLDSTLNFPLDLDSSQASRHLFLINRAELTAFREKGCGAEASILLKPVTRATLAAFLGHAAAAQEARLLATTSLRADCDDILQGLIQANLKLQEYDQERTNFLARAVHDFRAPLTAISGYCSLLLAEALGPMNADQKEVLERMLHSAKRLSRMAAAMFQLSVGRHVETRPLLEKSDVRDCVEQALYELRPFIEQKDLDIALDFRPAPDSLYFEREQIEQVLINLLDNACKFTPKRGSISIQGYPYFWERRSQTVMTGHETDRRAGNLRTPNAFRVDISDSGPGIPKEHLQRIFEEYTRYGGGQDRSGGGLGLAICKMILNRHQGSVWAESGAKGSVFSFVLPLRPPGWEEMLVLEGARMQRSVVEV